MRYCKDCGAEVEDIAMICSECGSKNLSLIESDNANVGRRWSKKAIIKTAIAAILAVFVIFGIVIGAKIVIYKTQISPVVEGMTALMKGDLDAYSNAFDEHLADTVRDKVMASTDSEKFKTSRLADLKTTYGENYKISVNAVSNKLCSEKTVTVLNEMYSQYDITIDEARFVTVTVYISGDSGELLQSKTLYSVKIGGKWSMLDDFSDSASES